MVLNVPPRRIGITGASGLVGRHAIALLVAKGISCVATSRTDPKIAGAQWHPSDLAGWVRPEQIEPLFGDVDAVWHLGAALPSGETGGDAGLIDVNVRASLILGQWALARKIPLIFISSCSIFNETSQVITEATSPGPLPLGGLYGLSKILAEQVFTHLSAQGLSCMIARPTAIYGWGMPVGKLVASLLARAQNDETITLMQPVDDRVNLLHVADLARALWLANEVRAAGIFNIGGPAQVSIREIAETCVRVAGRGRLVIDESRSERPPQLRFHVDGGKASRTFGYEPEIGLEDGLRRMANQTLSEG